MPLIDYLDLIKPKEKEWIEYVFLCVFAILLLVGLILLISTNIKWKKILRQIDSTNQLRWRGRNISISEIGNETELEEIFYGRKESFLEALPGIFLITGLLGTFIGLSIALSELARDTNNSSDLVITAIGTKFKSSIWGILGNLLFRAISGIFSYKGKVNEFILRVKLAFSAKENKIIKALEGISYSLNNSNGAIFKKIDGLQETSNNILHQLSLFGQSIAGILESLKESTKEFTKSASDFTKAVNEFSTKTTTVLNKIEEIIVKNEKLITDFTQETKKLFTDPEIGLQARLKELQVGLNTSMNNLNDKIGLLADLNLQLTTIQEKITSALNEQQQQNVKLSENAERVNGRLQSFLMKIEGKTYNSLNDAVKKVYSPENGEPNHLLLNILDQLKKMPPLLNDLKNSLNSNKHGKKS